MKSGLKARNYTPGREGILNHPEIYMYAKKQTEKHPSFYSTRKGMQDWSI